ncbi:12047_t:CDS:2, partial [Entrophospora sp. SA101]
KAFFNQFTNRRKFSSKSESKEETSPGIPAFFHTVTFRTMMSNPSANKKYPLPMSKEEELNWINDQHYFLRHMWQGNFSAPISDLLTMGGAKVLYVGFDSEKWLLDTSKEYPNTKFVGIITKDFYSLTDDNSDCEAFSLTNATFYNMNLLDGLPFSDNEFDLVFVRMYDNPFTEQEWEQNIIKEVVRLTKRGGWLELMPTDNRVFNAGPSFERWNEAVIESLKLKNVICEKLHMFLANTNQISSHSHQIMIRPVGSWGREFGELGVAYFKGLSAKLKSEVIGHLDMTEEEYNVMMTKMEEEFNSLKTYSFSHRFIAQKK